MSEVRSTRVRWWKVAGAIAVLLLIGWVLTVGLGHGGGSTGTNTVRLETGP